MAVISYDPWLKKENARFQYSSDSGIDDIIQSVHKTWNFWHPTPWRERSDLLQRLGSLLLVEKREHALTITSEMGKVIKQSLSEIEKCASLCYWYASNLEKLSSPEKRVSTSGESTIYFEPQGIILGIMPWNFPYWQAMRFIVPVIAGGNAVILRHASSVPLCSLNIEKAFRDAGFPENLCRSVFADYNQVERIIADPAVRGVSLTGSTEAGRRIAETAGRNLKKSVMELGGSDPFIVFDDADTEAASDAALFSRFQNCGQSCIAAKRLYVQSGIFERFLACFAGKVNNARIGDPYDPDTFIGPMVNEESLSILHSQVKRSIEIGDKLITGGDRHAYDKPLYKPSILLVSDENSPLVCEEVFGPVIPIIRFETVSDVWRLACSRTYGLGASVWTKNTDLALEIARQIDTGTVAINGFVRSDPALPFGGVKDSGYGRELSVEGFREFLNIKTITLFG
jgi:succinate-semialdehyde dehydrogenase/glutarate-semialdehyde dehydrogenase